MPANTFTLADHEGPWCAWCLKTMVPGKDRIEIHHVMPTDAVDKLLGWKFKLFSWTVPAHAQPCHRPLLQMQSGELSALLLRMLALSPGQLDRLNSKLHNLGFYWFPVLTYGRKLQGADLRYQPTTAHFFSSVSGVLSGRMIAKRILGDFEVPQRPEVLVNLSNLEFSSGSFQRSAERLDSAQRIVGSRRQAWIPAFLRRKAQLTVNPEIAAEARIVSSGDPYTLSTAILHQGWISFTHDRVPRTMPYFEALVERAPGLTWLYRAEVLFAFALCSLAVRKADEELYGCLAAAQYIYAMLGLAGPSSRFLWHMGDRAPSGRTPTEVLMNEHRFHRFGRQQRSAIRQMAIFGAGRTGVLGNVLGKQNLRDSIFDDLRGNLFKTSYP